MCKIDHADDMAIPCSLCRACNPHLNQPKPRAPKKKPEFVTTGWRDIAALTAEYRKKKRRRPVRNHVVVHGRELS